MLVLARVLTPADFGLVALATLVVSVLGYVQESGVGAALVHFRGDPRETASSALVFASASGLALACIVALAAPVYATFVHNPDVAPLVRALSVLLLFRGLAVVPAALLERGGSTSRRSSRVSSRATSCRLRSPSVAPSPASARGA